MNGDARKVATTHSRSSKKKVIYDVVFPAPSKQTATLVFLHGLGDSADGGWSDVMPEFQQAFPFLKVILPNAPTQPVTLNGGMRMQSWHDIVSLTNIDKENFKGLDDSKAIVESILNEEIAAGTPSNRIILGGFSQGAALSLYTGNQFPQTLAGILALSGYLPYTKGNFGDVVSKENKETSVLMCHGAIDQVVAYKIGQRSFDALKAARPENLEFKTYKGVGHHSSDEEMKDVAVWMKKIFG